MLEESIAEKVLSRLTGVTDYNINIMNEKGIIIASQDASRIGTFHEVAYNIIRQQQDLIAVSSDNHFLGTRNGVNLPIVNRTKVVGVVGITGAPEQVKPLAMMLKITIEVMLEFEIQEREANARRSMKELFFNQLLYQEHAGEQELSQQAEKLGYEANTNRIPILISAATEQESHTIADVCKKRDVHTKQDMLIHTTDGDVLIFLNLGAGEHICSDYREMVYEYLADVIQFVAKEKLSCKFYIGSIQNSLERYSQAYKHCLWLKRTHPEGKTEQFFYDYVFDYLQSCIPVTEMYGVFGGYVECMDEAFWNTYSGIMKVMEETNNNMVQSSNRLHMHKNTLVYQYNKIRQQLGINPLTNAKDNQFATCLSGYLDQV